MVDAAQGGGRRWVEGLIALAVVLLTLMVRLSLDSHAACADAEQAWSEGRGDDAILAWRHAIESYLPVGTCAGAAAERLQEVAVESEAAGNPEQALFALRSLRTGLMSTRHVWVPQGARLPQLHADIARLMAASLPADQDRAAAEQEFRAQLDAWRSRAPRTPFALGAALCFVAWLVVLPLGARRVLTPEGRLSAGAWRWALAWVGLLAAWLTLVRLA
jgi:hypothetical protein